MILALVLSVVQNLLVSLVQSHALLNLVAAALNHALAVLNPIIAVISPGTTAIHLATG
jgi:hypothetical protein